MRTRIIAGLVLAVLCIALPAFAVFINLSDTYRDVHGLALQGVSVYVYASGETTTVSGYKHEAGDTLVTWPLSTDPYGRFNVYVAGGHYDVRFVHAGYNIDTTWEDYVVPAIASGDPTFAGTVEANAFDADDWIAADGEVSSATLQTSGLANLGGSVTTGGTVTVGGDLYAGNQAWLSYNDVDEEYDFRLNNNYMLVRPPLSVYDNTAIYGDLYLYGKSGLGTLHANVAELDTLKPQTGSDLYVRSRSGKNDGVFHGQFFQFEPVDISVALPDTTGYEVGTLMYCSDDSFRYLAGAGIAKEWRTLGYAGYVGGEDNPNLVATPTSLTYTYVDSASQTVAFTNTGDGVATWTMAAESYNWLAVYNWTDGALGAAADTGTVEANNDSLLVTVLWDSVAQGASKNGTLTFTGAGGATVAVSAAGEIITGEDYVVEPNHPRLYFNENTIAEQRTKCKSAELEFYTGFIDYIDNSVVGDSYPLDYVYDQGKQLGRLAFAYAMEQDTTYMHEAVECAQSLFDDFTTTWDDDGDARGGMARFYDWCYEGFGDTRKALFGDSLAQAFKRLHLNSNYMTNPAHSQIVVMSKVMPLALAVAGDGFEDVYASAALDSIYAHSFGDYHMGANMDSLARDGGGYEGEHYSEDGGTAQSMSRLFWFWDYGTDYDSWSNSSNITGFGDYMLYDTSARTEVVYWDYNSQCGLGSYELYAFGSSKQSDAESHSGTRASRMLLVSQLANAYQDSSLIWMSDQFDSLTGGYVNTPDRWEHIIARDTLMTQSRPSLTAAGYTTAKQFSVGTVFMRENWDLSNASTDIWATYRHEQYPFGHAHADAGHFVIGRGHDLLLIDSGEYYNTLSDHHRSYFQQTIAHNAITVKLFGESFQGEENSGGQNLNDLVFSSPQFPLTLGAYTDSMASHAYRGIITDYEHRADTLTYIRSDLTSAYSSAKVDTVRREFVWMEPDGVFLVFDYVDAVGDSFLQKSLFHTINNPTLSEQNSTFSVTHGTSEATVTFYGHDSLQKVGGTGAEFEVNGTNYPIPACTDYHSDNGAYRIEALMARDTVQRWLLAIIETSVIGGASYGTVSFVTDIDDYVGAVVNGDTMLFHKGGGSYEYRSQ